jgi:hypothetical protein
MQKRDVLPILSTLLGLIHLVAAHGHDDHEDSGMPAMDNMPSSTPGPASGAWLNRPPSYWSLSDHSGIMFAHIGIMIVAWVFVLPVGK